MSSNFLNGPEPAKRLSFDVSGDMELIGWMADRGAETQVFGHSAGTVIGVAGTMGVQPAIFTKRLTFSGGFDFAFRNATDCIMFVFPMHGVFRVLANRREHAVVPGEAAAVHIRTQPRIGHMDGLDQVCIGIERTVFNERLSSIIERPIVRPLEFDVTVSTADSDISRLAAFVHCLANSDFGSIIATPTLMAGELSRLMADMFLQFWPHNHENEIQRTRPGIAPRHVKIALDYVHGHLTDLPTPEQLAQISGVSLRSLQYAFRNSLGKGIHEYQLALRLEAARDEIIRGSERPISEIGRAFGFAQPKHFSRAFAAAFGVPPTSFRRR